MSFCEKSIRAYQEFDFIDLEIRCWCGALTTLAEVRQAEKEEELMSLLEDMFSEEIPSLTEVNDFLWFEDQLIYESLEITPSWERKEETTHIDHKE